MRFCNFDCSKREPSNLRAFWRLLDISAVFDGPRQEGGARCGLVCRPCSVSCSLSPRPRRHGRRSGRTPPRMRRGLSRSMTACSSRCWIGVAPLDRARGRPARRSFCWRGSAVRHLGARPPREDQGPGYELNTRLCPKPLVRSSELLTRYRVFVLPAVRCCRCP